MLKSFIKKIRDTIHHLFKKNSGEIYLGTVGLIVIFMLYFLFSSSPTPPPILSEQSEETK